MSCRVNSWLVITLADKASTLPIPGAVGVGTCCRAWRGDDTPNPLVGNFATAPTGAEIEITATKSCEIGPLALYRDHDGRLALLGVLNGGQPIVIQKRSGGRIVGHVDVVRSPRFGERLIVGGFLEDAKPTNGALVTVRATPIYGAFA